MTQPLVSVVIPSHNYGSMIEETLQSVFQQTYKNIEVIVVDDDSTDNTKQVIQKYPSVTYYFIHHQGAKTPAYASNYALTKTKGDFIIFLGADDKLQPTYVEECYRRFKWETVWFGRNIGLVWTGCQEFGASTRIRVPRLHLTSWRFAFTRNPGGQLGAMFVPKTVYDSVGGYDESLVLSEDWDFAIRVLLRGYQAVSIPDPIHLCRVHSLNINHSNLQQQCLAQLKKKYPWSFKLFYTPYFAIYLPFRDRLRTIKYRTNLLFTNPTKFVQRLKEELKL